MCQKNRILWRDGIELLLAGKFFIRPEGMIPAEANDPLAFFVLLNGIGYALLQLLDAGDAIQPDGEHIRARAAEVHVGVIETRHDEFPFELDGFRARIVSATLEKNVIDFADAANLAIANGHSVGPRLRRVIGVDPAVKIHDSVRLALGCLALRT